MPVHPTDSLRLVKSHIKASAALAAEYRGRPELQAPFLHRLRALASIYKQMLMENGAELELMAAAHAQEACL